MKQNCVTGFFWFIIAISLQAICTTTSANELIIKSSVSPEFVDGLHAKYLKHIADQANLPLDIYPMPFARRLASLKDGTINLMVGLKRSHTEDGFEYLQPRYEELRASFFVRADSSLLSTPEAKLTQLVAGYSIDEKQMLQWARDNFAEVVTVTSLEQKIKLLEKRRIDTFVHFESSAKYKIRQLGLENVVVPAVYQPGERLSYHVAINIKSALYKIKPKLEKIIRNSVESGEFSRIRLTHEAEIAQKKADN